MFLNHLSIPHTPNPLFHPVSFFPNAFPNLFQILHCFMYHKPRQFRPSLSPSLSSTFSSHTPYLSASRMLCYTIHRSFSTKKCTEPHISSPHTISILSVLPQCDSAMNVISIHPFLITLLFNQFSERYHFTVLRFHSYF